MYIESNVLSDHNMSKLWFQTNDIGEKKTHNVRNSPLAVKKKIHNILLLYHYIRKN